MNQWPGTYKLFLLVNRNLFLRAKNDDKLVYLIFVTLVLIVLGSIMNAIWAFCFSKFSYSIAAAIFGVAAATIIWLLLSFIEAMVRTQKIFAFALMPKKAARNFILIHHAIGVLLTQIFVTISIISTSELLRVFVISLIANSSLFGLLGLIRARINFPTGFNSFANSNNSRAFYANLIPKLPFMSTIMEYGKANPLSISNIVISFFLSLAGVFALIYFKSWQMIIASSAMIVAMIQLSLYTNKANVIARDFAFLRTPNKIFLHDFIRLAIPQFLLVVIAIMVAMIEEKYEFLSLTIGTVIINFWLSWIWLLSMNRMNKGSASANLAAAIIGSVAISAAFAPLGIIAAIYFSINAYIKQSPEFWGKS
ncbi:MAG: hypothetical protein FD163_2258 [Hyphomonadaceae bacterium]|nr:MAG: hypothetical protein FD128_707 [Hyphomonadaceae bacterium]KAF0183538.1 MAG: hypothetical protein FD163_2258 [Hyphomonadaceae bacterium]